MESPRSPVNEPLVFAPFFRPQVWGGRRLAELLQKPLPAGTFGESWELSAQSLHVSTVREGPWSGATLRELWNERRGDLLGDDPSPPPEFPWLIKWLDCDDWLSVQVHPDDASAQRILGEPFGKTESWVVLHAEPTARIFAGLKSGVTADELRQRSRDGAVAECLHAIIPKAGDCVHLPAGTVHAVGGGVLIAEVQQTSDATFRLFDWNRVDAQGKSRELHLEQALECIDFQRGPVNPAAPVRGESSEERIGRELLVACPYYRLYRLMLSAAWKTSVSGVAAAMVLSGGAYLSTKDRKYRRRFSRGETVLIPAAVEQIFWEPDGPSPTVLLWISRPSPTAT
jgi:mannose-6-phosphate isomerase